jgi:Tfp pilus assembly protein PilF
MIRLIGGNKRLIKSFGRTLFNATSSVQLRNMTSSSTSATKYFDGLRLIYTDSNINSSVARMAKLTEEMTVDDQVKIIGEIKESIGDDDAHQYDIILKFCEIANDQNVSHAITEISQLIEQLENNERKELDQQARRNLLALLYNLRGARYTVVTQLEDAKHDFEKALELIPNFAEVYLNLGTLYAFDKQESLKYIEKALENDPDLYVAYYHKAMILLGGSDIDGALDALGTVIEKNPKFYRAISDRALLYQQLGKIDEAIEDASTLIEINSKDANAYLLRAMLYDYQKKHEQAMEDATQSILLNPSNHEAYAIRGIIKGSKGELDDALNDLNKSIQIKPTFAVALFNRGVIRFAKKQYDEALQDAHNAYQYDPAMEANYFDLKKRIEKARSGCTIL